MSSTTGQRGTSPVAGVRKPFITKGRATVLLGAVVVGVAIWAFWKNSNPPELPMQEQLPTKLGVVLPYQPLAMPTVADIKQPDVAPPAAAPPAPAPDLTMPKTDPIARIISNQAAATAVPEIHPNMLSYAAPALPAAPATSDPQTPNVAHPGGMPSTIAYAPSHLDGIKAGIQGDNTFVLDPGLLVCVMDTAIDSTFEGPVQCHIPFDIRPHGVTLLDHGSIIHATYSNNVKDGQSRMSVAADWVDDPTTGCYIQFDHAPMSDSLGRVGLPGNVDPHTWENIGTALMLTFSESALGVLQSAISKGGNSYISFSSGNISGLANDLLHHIPPTITKHQGDDVAVFVTKKLDFSPCYDVRIRNPR